MKLIEMFNEIKEKEGYVIYSDMDGVITDFDKRFMKYSKDIPPARYELENGTKAFWDLINKAGVEFWSEMDWMPYGKEYWKRIQQYNPILLSAPSQDKSSRIGKKEWVNKNLPGSELILAAAEEKQKYATPNHILIDDRKSNIDQWESKGGIGIRYISLSQVIEDLEKLGL
jgi:hypothetical protein